VRDARDVDASASSRPTARRHAAARRGVPRAGIPFVFDPGQGLPMFDGDELMAFLKLADYCTVNDYEAKLLTERTGRTLEQLAEEVEALVVTLGGRIADLHGGRRVRDSRGAAGAMVDPTGCGDAYRAGLLYGIGRAGTGRRPGAWPRLMGSLKIAHRGGQNHKLTRDEIAGRYSRRIRRQPLVKETS
jgi:adenosine kinase